MARLALAHSRASESRADDGTPKARPGRRDEHDDARAAATGRWSLYMAKHSATYLQAQLYCAIVKTALKHGAERVETDPVSGRIVVIRGNGGTETPTATFADLQAFRAQAVKMGHPSLATAASIAWEWLQREADIFATFDAAHYRPKDQPRAVCVKHVKTKEENWVPLFEDDGAALYPELMAELDAIKRERISGLMVRRDGGTREPWPTYPSEGVIDLRHMRWTVKKIILAAGLRPELSFRSFRHGGFTEAGDAELTDRQIMAQGRHKSPKVLQKYVKRTTRQVIEGTKKRHAVRDQTKAGEVS
jgi:hypothetical protein